MAETVPQLAAREAEIRARYGIPAEARRTLVLAESSHWDPNWLYTSQVYFDRYVEANLLQAVSELGKEPRRVYSIECMFFLRMFWEQHPELHETMRRLVEAGQLRITSTGVSSADTLLPQAEAILRDLLLGQEWLRKNGLKAEPKLAYFPDCFGHTPALPALLHAAGFSMTAFARLDGMHGMGSDYDPKSTYPRPGSSAESLQKKEKTLDFIWRAADGSQVLAHWNAYSYGQGDMIAYRGFMRIYLFPKFLYAEERSDSRVARRIQGYVEQLEPYSRTPYLFCPLGMDFAAPVPGLLELLDRYNERYYPQTGTWVVNAGLEDYLELLGPYQDRLPVLDLDPNPYWTGFYTSRPGLKKRCHSLLKALVEAESLSVLRGHPEETLAERPEIHEAWWAVSTANHHDFITGTSPDDVVYGEQIPMLEKAIQEIRPITKRLKDGIEATPEAPKAAAEGEEVTWERETDHNGAKIRITTPHYGLEISEAQGGVITRAWEPKHGKALLEGLSNELVDYQESGGLWRMGMEYRGGKFKLADRSSQRPTALEIRPYGEALEVRGQVMLAGQAFELAILCRGDSPWVRFRLSGKAAEGHTVCVRFRTGLNAQRLTMENPGGVAIRPTHKIYTPTFWPVQRFFHVQDEASQQGVACLFRLPGAAAYRAEEQVIELAALRNATREKAYGILPILACPASGHEREETTFEYGVCFTNAGGWRENRLPQKARQYARDTWAREECDAVGQYLDRSLLTNSEDAWLEALKPAWRGQGVIARLVSYALPEAPVRVGLRGLRIQSAVECDLRERDLQPLTVNDGQVEVQLRKTITSLRLILE
jgi:alpha-mannosidase